MANNVSIAKAKKGDTVILCAFTGMKIGVKEVVAANKTTVTIATDKGEAVFDRKTAKQIDPEPKAPRFANSIIPDDGSYVPPQHKKKAKPAKKVAKKAKPEPEDEEEDDAEEDEQPAPKKATKKPAAKKKAAPKPAPEPEEGEDDEDEDWDDDDFEEVE